MGNKNNGDSFSKSCQVIVSDGMEGKGPRQMSGREGKKEMKETRESAKAISRAKGGKSQKYQDVRANSRRHGNGGSVGISNKCKSQSIQSAVPAMECGWGWCGLRVWGVHHCARDATGAMG